jgi:hypothetical protein
MRRGVRAEVNIAIGILTCETISPRLAHSTFEAIHVIRASETTLRSQKLVRGEIKN